MKLISIRSKVALRDSVSHTKVRRREKRLRGKFMVRHLKLLLLCLLISMLFSGCVLTKVITVPMRLGGAVISIVPVVGNKVHDSIDETAEIIDDLPF